MADVAAGNSLWSFPPVVRRALKYGETVSFISALICVLSWSGQRVESMKASSLAMTASMAGTRVNRIGSNDIF